MARRIRASPGFPDFETEKLALALGSSFRTHWGGHPLVAPSNRGL